MEIEPAPFGVMTRKGGNVRVYAEAYDVVFLRTHPTALNAHLVGLRRRVRRLMDRIKDVYPDQYRMYAARMEILKGSTRPKRNILGDGLKWLTGVATEDDVNKIKKVANKLLQSDNQQNILIKDTIVYVKENRKHVDEIVSKVNELTTALNAISVHIRNITGFLDKLMHLNYMAEISLIVENSLSYLELYDSKEQRFHERFQYKRDAAVIGHLTETLIPRSELQVILDKIRTQLSPDYMYTNMPVRVLTLDRNKLGFWIEIPILTGETYTAWSVSTAPFDLKGVPRALVPEIFQVGVGLNSGNLIPLEMCAYINPILCPSPVQYKDMVCVEGLLSRDADKIATCPLMEVPQPEKMVSRVSDTVIMIYSTGETIQERCPEGEIRSYPIAPGTYTIVGKLKCMLSSTAGWQFQPMVLHDIEVSTTDIFTLKELVIDFELPEPTQMTVPEMNVSPIREMIIDHQARLPSLSRVKYVQLYNVTGASAGWIAFLLVCAVVTFLTIMWHRRKRMVRLREESVNKPEVVQPVAEVNLNVPKDNPVTALYPALHALTCCAEEARTAV